MLCRSRVDCEIGRFLNAGKQPAFYYAFVKINSSVSDAYLSARKRSEVVNSALLLCSFGFSTERDRLETAACSGAPQRLTGLLTEGTRIYSRDQSRLVERQCSCPAILCGWAGRPPRHCSRSAFSESRLFLAPERSARPVLQRVTGIVFSPPFFPLCTGGLCLGDAAA